MRDACISDRRWTHFLYNLKNMAKHSSSSLQTILLHVQKDHESLITWMPRGQEAAPKLLAIRKVNYSMFSSAFSLCAFRTAKSLLSSRREMKI